MRSRRFSASDLLMYLLIFLSVCLCFFVTLLIHAKSTLKFTSSSSEFSRLFLGHREFGYQVAGLSVIAATVDRYAQQIEFNQFRNVSELEKSKNRFDAAVLSLSDLATDQVNMPEMFLRLSFRPSSSRTEIPQPAACS